ncbi:MAG: hypothetical protein ACRDPY_45345 [Streptosporangiaceae bacterium]
MPQQVHLDTTVPTVADLDAQHERAVALGGAAMASRAFQWPDRWAGTTARSAKI